MFESFSIVVSSSDLNESPVVDILKLIEFYFIVEKYIEIFVIMMHTFGLSINVCHVFFG